MASPQPLNPTFVSGTVNSGSFTSGTSVTVSSTGSVTAGNLQVVVLTVGGATAPSALSPPAGGWTTYLSTTANTGGGLIVTAIFYLKAASTGAFSGAFTWTTTATRGRWAFMELTGEGASLVDGSVVTSQNASGTNTSPSVTPSAGSGNDTLICGIIGAAVGADTLTNPAGMSTLFGLAGSGSQPFFYGASLALGSTSATGTQTWTIPTGRTCLGFSFLVQQSIIPGESPQVLDPPARLPLSINDLRTWTQNLLQTTLQAPLVGGPFRQFDWPLSQRVVGNKATGEAVGTLSPLLTPAAVVTYVFRAPIFSRLIPPQAKATGEAIGGIAPLLTPNPPQPFVQSQWDLATRAFPKLVSEVSGTLLPLLEPAVTTTYVFRAPIFSRLIPPQAKATGEAIGGIAPLLTPNPPQPFVQSQWDLATRAFPKLVSEVSGTLAPLLTPNPPRPFFQTIWDSATPPKPKAYAEPLAAISALYNPNPAQPFYQTDWQPIRFVQKAKVDDVVNLTPLYTVVVPSRFFHQDDWPNAAIARPKVPDTSLAGSAPLLTPNPPQPFVQSLWDLASLALPKVIGEAIGTLLPLLEPAVTTTYVFRAPIFSQIVSPQKAKVDDVVNLLPLQPVVIYMPLPVTWPSPAEPVLSAKVDDVVNLLPINSFVFVQPPFHQDDWLNTARTALSLKSEVYGSPSALVTPNPAQPFVQSDWPRSRDFGRVQASDAPANELPFLHPNPTQPFVQSDWLLPLGFAVPVDRHAEVNLLPLFTGPPPSTQTAEWLIRARRRHKR